MADGRKDTTNLGGISILLPEAGCTDTRSSLFFDSKFPNEGIATTSASVRASAITEQRAACRAAAFSVGQSSVAATLSRRVLLSIEEELQHKVSEKKGRSHTENSYISKNIEKKGV